LAAGFAGVVIAAQGSGPEPTSAPDTRGIDAEQRRIAVIVETSRVERARAIDELCTILAARPDRASGQGISPAWAIRQLAQLKAVEAASLLTQRIEYDHDLITADSKYGKMIVVGALVEIGLGAVPGVLSPDVLSGTSPEALRRIAIVVRDVFPDAKTARAFVDAYDPGYTPAARAKLDELKKELAKLP
jgi:hypothetical protein